MIVLRRIDYQEAVQVTPGEKWFTHLVTDIIPVQYSVIQFRVLFYPNAKNHHNRPRIMRLDCAVGRPQQSCSWCSVWIWRNWSSDVLVKCHDSDRDLRVQVPGTGGDTKCRILQWIVPVAAAAAAGSHAAVAEEGPHWSSSMSRCAQRWC